MVLHGTLDEYHGQINHIHLTFRSTNWELTISHNLIWILLAIFFSAFIAFDF